MDSVQKQVNEVRVFFDGLGSIYPPSKDITVQKEIISGINCYWFLPDFDNSENILIYLHGGSFALGSIKSHQAMVSYFAKTLKSKVLFIEYALAPENPFPKGMEDVLKVYEEISSLYKNSKIFIIGDSAGGGILLSSLFELGKQEIKYPDGIVLISPWLDLRCENPSFETRKNLDKILTKDELKKFAGYYASGNIHYMNPAELNFKKFPPTLILVGTNEILFDDSKHFYDRIKTIQPNSEMKVYEDQSHVWLLTDMQSEGSQKALKDIGGFIQQIND